MIYIKSIAFIFIQFFILINAKIKKIKGHKVILYVGQVHSPHFKSFISNLWKYRNHNYVSFCTYPYHDNDLRHSIFDISLNILFKKKITIKSFLDKIYLNAENPISGIKIIFNLYVKFLKPDIIWFHELQSSSYLIDFDKIQSKTKIFCTVYGNDLKLFINDNKHSVYLKKIISKTNLFHVETNLEHDLLRKHAYNKKIIIGSATLKVINKIIYPQNCIKKIDLIVKGGNSYRSSTSSFYEMLNNHHRELNHLKILIFDCDKIDYFRFSFLKAKYNLNLTLKERLNPSEIKKYLAISKFLLFNSYSDGMSNLTLESWENKCIVLTTRENGFSELYNTNLLEQLIFESFPNYKYFLKITKQFNDSYFKRAFSEINKNIYEYYCEKAIVELSEYLPDE